MSDLKDLRESRGKLIEDARAIVDKAKAEKRAMTTEEQANYDKAMDKQEELRTQIVNEERLQEAEREAAEAARVKAEQEGRSKGAAGEQADAAKLEARAFRKALMGGVGTLTAEEARALSFDTDSAGGYLSPPVSWINQLIKFIDDQTFIRQRATVQQLNGAHSVGAPSLENDPADSAWTSEIGSVDEDSTMSFGGRELVPHLLTKLVKVSMKLLNHSVMPAETIVANRLAYKFAITEEKAFLTGTGASQPLGLFTASAQGISTGQDVSTGNSTTAIGADGLIEAKYKLKGQYQMAAEWLFHRDAIKAISKLKDGDGQYLWRPGLEAGSPDMILGRPLMMSEYVPNTFTSGLYVGMFGVFSNYWIVENMNMTVQRLNELYAATSQVGFIGRQELDGAPVLEEAFARVKLA